MAGGRGIRMKLQEEKPLIKVCGKPMIERVLEALKNARKVDEIIIAVSKHTLKTTKAVKKFSVKVIETPGEDYVFDMQYVVKRLKLSVVMIVSADLPLLTSKIIDDIISCYERCNKPALTVVVPADVKEKLGLTMDYVLEIEGRRLVPAGINMISRGGINEEELEEEILVLDEKEVAINVNTIEDLKVAETILSASGKCCCSLRHDRSHLPTLNPDVQMNSPFPFVTS